MSPDIIGIVSMSNVRKIDMKDGESSHYELENIHWEGPEILLVDGNFFDAFSHLCKRVCLSVRPSHTSCLRAVSDQNWDKYGFEPGKHNYMSYIKL